MRQEFLEFALLSPEQKEIISLPTLDASVEELDIFRSANEVRGEQPVEAIHSLPGALRGDVPLSSPDKEIK